MKCRPACVWRREDEGDWNVFASGVFDLQISKKNPSHVHRLFSKLKIADRQIHKAGINLQNWELRVGLPLQKLPWEESHWKNSSVTPPKFQKSTNKSQIGYVDDFFLWRSMFGFLVPFLVGLNGCTSRLFTSNFLRHSKNVSSTRCGENPKNCMGIWWRFSRIPRPSKGVKFHPRGLFLVFFW